MKVLLLLLAAVVETHGISLSYIQDVALKPIGTQYVNKTTTINGSCDQCKCKIFGGNTTTSNVALNCFPNNTCQLFLTFPPSYKLQYSAAARLYFHAYMPLTASQCCMPNITELVNRLKNTTPTVVPLSKELITLGYDEVRPDRAVAIGWNTGDLYWFNPINMSHIKNQTINGHRTIALQNNSIFTAIDYTAKVTVFADPTLSSVANASYRSLQRVRKLIFLNNSRTIVATTQDNKSVTLLDVSSPTQYTVQVRVIERLAHLLNHCLSENSPAHCKMRTVRRRSMTRSSTCHRGAIAPSCPTSTRTPRGSMRSS